MEEQDPSRATGLEVTARSFFGAGIQRLHVKEVAGNDLPLRSSYVVRAHQNECLWSSGRLVCASKYTGLLNIPPDANGQACGFAVARSTSIVSTVSVCTDFRSLYFNFGRELLSCFVFGPRRFAIEPQTLCLQMSAMR